EAEEEEEEEEEEEGAGAGSTGARAAEERRPPTRAPAEGRGGRRAFAPRREALRSRPRQAMRGSQNSAISYHPPALNLEAGWGRDCVSYEKRAGSASYVPKHGQHVLTLPPARELSEAVEKTGRALHKRPASSARWCRLARRQDQKERYDRGSRCTCRSGPPKGGSRGEEVRREGG
ncbi:unnamed protein product, partial [Prorocentrum cordatum]